MKQDDDRRRWAARPIQAGLIRAFVFLVPIAGSVVFLHFAARLVKVPEDSFLLFITWWIGMSGSATVVLIAIERVARRLLPLAALCKLSLIFPDAAPSRFRTAMHANTVDSLEQRIARTKALGNRATPAEAAERLLVLVAELNSHDRLTRGHSDRVRAYSQMIGKELHLPAHDLDRLNWAALLHDVGKLEVPAEILTKPGRPTDEEWQILRRHPEFGMTLVAPLQEWLGEWTEAVGQHHERWDGKGYPKALSGDRIAIAARIVAVADVFDVITSARSYKPAIDSAVARQEIAGCAGAQFDPRVVRAFLNVSLGRLRLVMGPLSWLAHAPLLGRLPLTPAIGGAAATLASVVAAVGTGFGPTPAPAVAAPVPPRASTPRAAERDFARTMQEDQSTLVGVERAGDAKITWLGVTARPEVGRVRVTEDDKLVYTPPPNFNGTVSLGYRACWRQLRCQTGTVAITVEPVNDLPVARDDTVSTKHGERVVIDVLANDSDPDGDRLSIRSVSKAGGGRAQVVGGLIHWIPKRGFKGATSFAYVAADGHGGTARATVRVHVGRPSAGSPSTIDEAPSEFEVAPPSNPPSPQPGEPEDQPPTEQPSPQADSPPRAVEDRVSVPAGGTVTIDVLANDGDADGDRISILSVGSPDRGRAQQVGDRIQYSAPPDFVGDVSFPYAITAGGATDGSRVLVSVRLVNNAPTFTSGSDQKVLEDAGPQRVVRWARNIDPGAASEAGQTVSFLVSNSQPSLFRAQPDVHPDGSLTYTPAADANGVATVSVRARDDGGTASGGRDTSASQQLTITVKPVNDPPSFTPGADQTAPEDAGAQTVGWATNIVAGPANESGQAINFIVTNGRGNLFTSGGQPRVAPDGTLTYTPALGASGSTTVTVHLKDDGGTADGGDDTSPTRTFTITIQSVNDPPSFTEGPDQTVAEDSGTRTVPAWATGISPGPADESAQTVSFVVTNDNASLFATQPAVASNGTLTFAPAPGASGSASVTVRAQDNGGGTDTSPPQTFTITVTPVNDVPVATADNVTVAEDDPVGVTFDVLANDTDGDPGDTLSLSSYDGSTIANGTLTHNGAGSFTYVPDPAFSGTETFTYVVADSSGATATGTVTITVTDAPSSPVAGDDAYLTAMDTPLSIAAPGVLSNDADPDGDILTVQTAPISGPTTGAVSLASDGSFTYTPAPGFTGTDLFTYRIDDGTGRTDDGTVEITVSSGSSTSTLYLRSTGPSADVWNLLTSAPAVASPEPDHDGDLSPGLTIKASDGDEVNTDPAEWQDWVYSGAPLALTGPVVLQLWSTVPLFTLGRDAHVYVYLYDCQNDGSNCVKIAENDALVSSWNLLPSWVYHEFPLGSVSRNIPGSHELRVKILFGLEDMWIAMSGTYPSALSVTVG